MCYCGGMENEIFKTATSYELNPVDWELLCVYMNVGDDEETLELIADLAQSYPDPVQAEVGFVFLMAYIQKLK